MPTRTVLRGEPIAMASIVTTQPVALDRREANALVEMDQTRPRPSHAIVRALAEVLGVGHDGRRTEGRDLDPVAVWREDEAGTLTGRMVLLDGRARVSAYKRANRNRIASRPRGVPAVIYSGPLPAVLNALPK